MKNKKTTRLVLIIASIVLALIAVISTTQAYFSSDTYASNPNEYQSGILSIEAVSKSNNISLDNTLPMSDTEGLTTTPYVFTIKNNGNVDYKFDVKLLATSDDTFDSQYIKLQVDNEGVSTLSSLTNSIIKKDVVLYAGETIDISVRIWLSENTKNTQIGKSFNSKIVIDGQSMYTETNTDIVTSIEDFDYYLGSEYSEVSSIKVYDEDDGVYYDLIMEPIPLNSNEVLLTKYKGKSKNVVVPDTYIAGDTIYNVILLSYVSKGSIDDGVFYNNKLIENVYLSDNIKLAFSLYDAGFYNWNYACNLFYGCTSLVNVPEIPSSVTYMESTFKGCTNLTGIVKINSSNVSYFGSVFEGTTKSIEVQVPSGSTTYDELSGSLPSNVKLTTFTS